MVRKNFRKNLRIRKSIRGINRRIQGIKLPVPADPPGFVQIPWNKIWLSDTISLSADKNQKSYSPKDLHNIFVAQIGLTTTTEMSYRLIRVQTWNLSGNFINLQCQDLTIGLGAQDYLIQVEDQSGRNKWAKVGYAYPVSQTKVSFSSIDDENLFRVGCEKGDKLEVRCLVLWKPRVNTLPNNRSKIKVIEERIAALELLASKMVIGE